MTVRLGDLLVAEGLLTQDQLGLAIRSKATGVLLGDWLLQEGYVSPDQLGQALERQFDCPYVTIDCSQLNPQVVRLIPEPFARSRMVVALGVSQRTLKLAMVAPDDIETIAEVELITGYRAQPCIAQDSSIRAALDRGYDDRSIARQTVVDMKIDELERLGVESQIVDEVELVLQEEAPVVRLVQAILSGAVDAGASDIHLEPCQPEMRVRYRIDGELQQIMTIPAHIEHLVISRIKVMADMNTTESRRPQDGHLSLAEYGKKVNFRVSSIPTVIGEKVVLRLLDEGNRIFDLAKLGVEPRDMQLLLSVIEKPHGMFVVTGPTGSGKSTTLYALLSRMNAVARNIVTIEDPVEYRLAGINQVQSDNDFGMGFANALKYIMRQDPDVIMVGEIRDRETAGLAVQAALTGHLMISTLHTNDAPSAVVRLSDLGVDNFKVASALLGSIAQRLLRRVCSACKIETAPGKELANRLGMNSELRDRPFYRGVGCAKCFGTGYSGRLPIFEIMIANNEIAQAIEQGSPATRLRELACQSGMQDLMRAGIEQALAGNTSLEEVYFKTMS